MAFERAVICFVALTISFVFIPCAIDAQLGIDRSPPVVYMSFINATAISVEEKESLPDYAKCPAGLHYVKSYARPLLRNPNVINDFNNVDRYFGCCPPNTQACLRNTFGVILECCPVGTVCCISETGQSYGCARDYAQCCEGIVCPEGYGCCAASQVPINETLRVSGSSLCCPIPANVTDPSDFSGYCEIDVNVPDTYAEYDMTGYTGCKLSYTSTLPWCPMPLPSYVNCSLDVNSPEYCANETVRCKSVSECAYAPIPTPLLFNSSGTIVEFNMSLVGGCCPNGTQACWGDDGSTFSGCVDPLKNETCCGSRICTAGSRCCSTNYTTEEAVYDYTLEQFIYVPVNATRYLGCCPTLLECCEADIANPFSRNDTFNYFFCGKSYDSTQCAVDMTREAMWYRLYRAFVAGLNDE